MKNIKKISHWKKALLEIWKLNRVHVSTEMSLAYRLLKKYYKNLKIFGYLVMAAELLNKYLSFFIAFQKAILIM